VGAFCFLPVFLFIFFLKMGNPGIS
jgi:hypothetical protein